jgi:hypothetical protein
MSKTRVVFGDSADDIIAWSQTAATAMGQSQRQALGTANSFGALFRPLGLTGKTAAEQSKRLTQLGADLASFYNTDVQSALDAIRSGVVGESEPLRKYGVLLSETRVQQEALNETGKKNAKQLTAQEKAIARVTLIFKDSAVAQGDFARTSGGLANQLRIAGAHIDDLQTQIGQLLIPAVTDAVNKFNDWISNTENQQRVLDTVKQAIAAVKGVVGFLVAAFKQLNDITGSTKHSLELLFGVLVAYKTAKLAIAIGEIATQIANIGINARRSRGQLGGPGGKGGLLRDLANIALGGGVGGAAGGGKGGFLKKLGVAGAILAAGMYSANKTVQEFYKLLDKVTGNADKAKDSMVELSVSVDELTTKLTGMTPAAIAADKALQRSQKQAFAQSQRLRLRGDLDGGGRPGPIKYTRAQVNQFFDAAIQRALTRASYQTLTQQLASYTAIAAKLRARIRVTQDITRQMKLEEQLWDVLARRKDVRQQLAQKALDALQLNVDRASLTKGLGDDLAALYKLRDALKRRLKVDKDNADLQSQLIGVESDIIAKREEAAERRREARQQRQERLSTQLFAILGFGPGGAPKIPNIRQLRAQFDAMKQLFANAPARIKREAERIQKVLERAFLPPDIRSKLREMLNDYKRQLKGAADTVGDPTKFTHTDPARLLAGLGLSPQQLRVLRRRMAVVGAGGSVPAGRSLAFAGAGGVHIAGNVNVYNSHNIGDLENQITKRQAARPHNRRGAR